MEHQSQQTEGATEASNIWECVFYIFVSFVCFALTGLLVPSLKDMHELSGTIQWDYWLNGAFAYLCGACFGSFGLIKLIRKWKKE